MDDIKYLGVQGLEELIILAQNGLAKKADTLQFDVMPDPIKYIGKIVQYVGVSDISFTRSHFYYSNGIKWTEENISGSQTTQIEMVTVLPSWVNADPQILYILKNTADKKMGLYVKNPSVNDSWFTVETSGSFTVVATLPQWADADPSTIYFKADGNILTGYIKKTGTIGAWYTLGGGAGSAGGGAGSAIVIDAALSATSENPVQNKVIYAAIQDADKKLHDGIEANANALGLLGTEVSGIHDDITANQTEIAAIKQNLLDTYATQRYVQDADKKLHDGIEANANALGLLGTEVSGIHDDITANQTEIAAIKQNLSANQTEIEANSNALGLLGTEVSGIHDDIETNSNALGLLGTEVGGIHDALLTKEDTANKTTVIDATATDDQYPSAKAVYDALEGSATSGSAATYPRPDWANAVDISAEQLYTGYTAPSDGIFICSCVVPPVGGSGFRTISVNGIVIAKGRYRADTEYGYGGSCCPVSKDDLIKANSKGAWGGETRYFVPYKAQ